MMAQKQAGPPLEDWDIDWRYTDGPLENFGWQKSINRDGVSEMMPDGLHISSNQGFVQYQCPALTCKRGIAEVDFLFGSFSDSANGFRFVLSDGSKGNQIHINNDSYAVSQAGVQYNEGSRKVKIRSLPELNTQYKLKIEFDASTGNKVFWDGEKIYETSIFSKYYAAGNRIFQQAGGETILKALRYKFIER